MWIVRRSNDDAVGYQSEAIFYSPRMSTRQAWDICNAMNSVDPLGPDYYEPATTDAFLNKFAAGSSAALASAQRVEGE